MAAIDMNKKYTADEFFEIIPETNEKYELIDGEIVMQAAPSTVHQRMVGGLYSEFRNFIKSKGGKCEPFISPYDVKLDDSNCLQPDLLVVCDPNKIDDKRCNGAPDFVVEVVSGDRSLDFNKKLELYKSFGVKEYWIADPREERTVTYVFDNGRVTDVSIYPFDAAVPVNIFGGALKITINDLL